MVNIKDIELNLPEEKEVQGIKVKQYLPMEDKMALIGNIVNNSVDDNNFYNPTRLHIYYVMGILNTYTDLDLGTETILNVYDKIVSNGLWKEINEAIPEEERNMIQDFTKRIIDNIYNYKNSAVGILESIGNNYQETKEEGKGLQEAISNPANLKLLKEIIDKLA